MTSLSKIIFALAALIFAVSQLIDSLQPAHALSSHNISSGSNPIVNINGELVMNSITTTPIWTNNTQDDFIVTTYIQDSTGCYLTVSGQTTGLAKISYIANIRDYKPSTVFLHGKAKLKIAPGETIDLAHYNNNYNQCNYYIEGYYTHS